MQNAQLRLIGWSLVVGATIFAAIAIGLPFFSTADEGAATGDPTVLMVLSGVHAFAFLQTFILQPYIKRTVGQRPNGVFMEHLMRWAILEGAVLVGVIVVLLAGLQGVLPEQEIYYANLFSLAWFWVVVARDTEALKE